MHMVTDFRAIITEMVSRLSLDEVWNTALTYIQLLKDIFNYIKISSNKLK